MACMCGMVKKMLGVAADYPQKRRIKWYSYGRRRVFALSIVVDNNACGVTVILDQRTADDVNIITHPSLNQY